MLKPFLKALFAHFRLSLDCHLILFKFFCHFLTIFLQFWSKIAQMSILGNQFFAHFCSELNTFIVQNSFEETSKVFQGPYLIGLG